MQTELCMALALWGIVLTGAVGVALVALLMQRWIRGEER